MSNRVINKQEVYEILDEVFRINIIVGSNHECLKEFEKNNRSIEARVIRSYLAVRNIMRFCKRDLSIDIQKRIEALGWEAIYFKPVNIEVIERECTIDNLLLEDAI